MTKDEEIAELKAAFQVFSESSDILAKSYLGLQEQVKLLSNQLEQSEKTAVKNRIKIVF